MRTADAGSTVFLCSDEIEDDGARDTEQEDNQKYINHNLFFKSMFSFEFLVGVSDEHTNTTAHRHSNAAETHGGDFG